MPPDRGAVRHDGARDLAARRLVEGLALVPLGLVLLVAAGWISDGMAAMSRALARWGAR